jgi:AcrR family transcriptional regulator
MGRRSLKESRQQEIIVAFYRVSKKIGLENSSIAKIADHLGINPSLILHYFKTKEELYSGLIRYILEKYSGIYKYGPNDISSPRELQHLIDNLFSRKWNDLIDDGVFYSCYAQVYRSNNIRRAFRVLHDSLRNILVEALEQAQEKGIIEVENPRDTAELIFALMEGAYYYLGMVSNRKVYSAKLALFRDHALMLLNIPVNEPA